VHLVGFIIRIYHDARSPERQKHEQIKITLEVSRLIQIAGEIVRVVVNGSLGRGVREKYRERERERMWERIFRTLLVVATVYCKS
jgi:hypothetical protein